MADVVTQQCGEPATAMLRCRHGGDRALEARCCDAPLLNLPTAACAVSGDPPPTPSSSAAPVATPYPRPPLEQRCPAMDLSHGYMGHRICVGASPEGEKVSRKVVGAGGMAPAGGWTGLRGEREREEMEQRRDGDEEKRFREDQILRQRDKVEDAWACGPVGYVACCEGAKTIVPSWCHSIISAAVVPSLFENAPSSDSATWYLRGGIEDKQLVEFVGFGISVSNTRHFTLQYEVTANSCTKNLRKFPEEVDTSLCSSLFLFGRFMMAADLQGPCDVVCTCASFTLGC
ncbi:hypothetical protein TRIUR3_15934 [Triticum urartu]|uniref:Uncharacterized protein n=1 Tax=Triticum urartu TaxID=4572 RepID=M7ZYE5_TRIUA|nr:hypothetical protein TRIUR3_15934 [Triticum urartu]